MKTTLIDIEIALVTGTYVQLHNETIIAAKMEQASFSGSKYENVVFEDVTFVNCDFWSTNFQHVHFIDCKFINCTFSFSKFDKCSWVACTVENCTFCITNSLNNNFLSCTYLNCNWQESKNLDSVLANCNLDETSSVHLDSDNTFSLYDCTLLDRVAA